MIRDSSYSCNITAFPAYVVNVTTVKQIQLAVNFARNNNIRLTIKSGPTISMYGCLTNV